MKIIAFKLMSDYAHFSHPATIYSSLTYPIPPKTTVMGLLGAIIGEKEYYKLSNIKYSVIIDSSIYKKRFVFNGVSKALGASMHIEEGCQDNSVKKQFYREVIKNPSYVVILNLEELASEYQKHIVQNLKEHKSVYTPYLGINFCIADFEWIDIYNCYKIEESESKIDSFTLIDDFIFEPDLFNIKITTAKMACDCEKNRIFKNFKDFIIKVDGLEPIKSKNSGNIYQINDYKVYFV